MTDRGHLHHRLLQSGLSHKTALILVGVLSSVLSLGVLASRRFENDNLAFTAAVVVVAFLVLSRLLGFKNSGWSGTSCWRPSADSLPPVQTVRWS